MNLQIDGQYVAEVVPGVLTGQKAVGKHRLMLPLKFSSVQWPSNSDLKILDLTADCTVESPPAGGPVGRFVQQRQGVVLHVRPGVPAGSPTAYLVIDLDPRQIEAIDDLAPGRELSVLLDVRGLAQINAERFVDVWCQIHHSVTREVWVKAMEASGYRQTLFVEVSLTNPAAQSVYKHAQSAEANFRRAAYDECVGQCRLALEALGTLTKTEDKRAHLKQALDKKELAEAMPLEDRLLALRYALTHVCHPSHHADANSQTIHYDREDARTVLHATLALVGHYLAGPGRSR